MSDHLNALGATEPDPRLADVSTARSGLRPTLRYAGLIVAAFVTAGVICGLCWSWGFTPISGTVTDGVWRSEQMLDVWRSTFDGTGRFIAMTGGAGLLIGAVAAIASRSREMVTTASVAAGSGLMVLIARTIAVVGQPADPTSVAATAADGTVLSSRLELPGWEPLVAGPLMALGIVLIVFLMVPGREATDSGS